MNPKLKNPKLKKQRGNRFSVQTFPVVTLSPQEPVLIAAMKIKLLKGWNGQSAGAILEPELHAVATTLIQRGIAVEIDAKPQPKGNLQKVLDDPVY